MTRSSQMLFVAMVGLCILGLRPASAASRALLIGVSDYQDPSIEDPSAFANDANALKTVLIQRMGLRAAQIKVLTGTETTRNNVLNAIKTWLVEPARRGDDLLLYFAGHGSQIADTNGDETDDGRDEVLCPADYIQKTGANGIIDDELAKLLKPLESENLLVLLDTCHSGTATKSIGGQLRDLPTIGMGTIRSRYLPPPNQGGTKSLSVRRGNSKGITLARDLDHVLFAACRDFDRAGTARFRIGGKFVEHGVFTYMLLQGLTGRADADGDGQITYRELDAFVDRTLLDSPYQFTQRPELRARSDQLDRPFLGMQKSPGLTRVSQASGGKLEITLGVMDGIRPGDRVRIYTKDRGLAGVMTVEQADAYAATASFTPESGDESASESFAAQLSQGSAEVRPAVEPARVDSATLRVWIGWFFENDKERFPPEGIRQALQGIDGVEIVKQREQADRFVVGEVKGNSISIAIALRSERIIKTLSGSTASVSQQLADAIRTEYLKHQLQATENKGGHAAIDLRVAGGRREFISFDDPKRQEEIQLEIDVARGGYLTLLSVDSQGGFTLLLPNNWQRDNRVQAGQAVRVPPDSADFRFTIEPPAGRDMIKAIWTAKPLALKGIGTKALDQGFFQAKTLAGAIDLLRGIRNNLHQNHTIGTKGFVPEPTPGGGLPSAGQWATATIHIDTFPPGRN